MTTTENIYSADNVPASNWMQFSEAGVACKGVFKEKFEKAGVGSMPDQVVFVLDKATRQKLKIDADGNPAGVESEEEAGLLNVGIRKTNSFVINRTKKLDFGQVVAFAFTKEIPPKQKGYHPAKSIMPYVGKVDEDYVKENKKVDEEISVEDVPF